MTNTNTLFCLLGRKLSLYLALCELENEMLKEAKNAEKSFLDQKMSFLSVFSLFKFFIFQLAQP